MWLCHAGWKLKKTGPGAGKTGDLVAGALMDESPQFTAAIFGRTGGYSKAGGAEIHGETRPNADAQVTDYSLEIRP